jgi:SWI2/SNF2 ATPase
LPNASFIGFPCNPIEKTDANTRVVFGDYIFLYDIQRTVADEATVPIYYGMVVTISRRIAALAVRSVAGANTNFLAAGPGWTSATARKAPLTPAPAILASLEMNPTQKPFSLNRGASIHRPL